MAKQSSKKGSSEMVTDTRPCFFKIMLEDLNTEHLRIPLPFMKHLPKHVSDTAILRGPCGGNWQVRLVKRGDHLFMVDGLQKFIRDQSLGDAEFSLFNYDGNMHFSVQIFDKTGLERIKMHVPNSHQEATFHIGRREHACIQNPHKRTEEMLSSQVEIKSEEIDPNLEDMDIQVKKVQEMKVTRGKAIVEETSVGKAAKSFASKLPYFQTCLKSYHVYKTFVLQVPKSFGQENLPKVKTKMILRNSEGKAWEVNCIPGPRTHTLCGGLPAFMRDNNLKPGDVCIFELVKERELQFHLFGS